MSDEHRHSFQKIENRTGPFPAEGVDGNGKPTVVFYYVTYWVERCTCGEEGSSGNYTTSA